VSESWAPEIVLESVPLEPGTEFCGHKDCRGHGPGAHQDKLTVRGRVMEAEITHRSPDPDLSLNIGMSYPEAADDHQV
jgi:hypothetical protein